MCIVATRFHVTSLQSLQLTKASKYQYSPLRPQVMFMFKKEKLHYVQINSLFLFERTLMSLNYNVPLNSCLYPQGEFNLVTIQDYVCRDPNAVNINLTVQPILPEQQHSTIIQSTCKKVPSDVTGRNCDFLVDSRPPLFLSRKCNKRLFFFMSMQIVDRSSRSESVSEQRWTEC